MKRMVEGIITLPAFFHCKSDAEMCIWPRGRRYPPTAFENSLKDDKGYHWVYLTTDGEALGQKFVQEAQNDYIVYCSNFTCGRGEFDSITKVVMEEQRITMALTKIREQCKNDSSDIIHDVTQALERTAEICEYNSPEENSSSSSNHINLVVVIILSALALLSKQMVSR